MRRLSILFFSWFFVLSATAQLQSPEAYLGYEIGDRFTPHWKITGYFQSVASAVPGMVKLEKYGETNEGRPLQVAFISSPENMQNLEMIRKNNLRLAHLAKDRMAPLEEGAPVIVWLSYNVHGNETSSSEAAMLMLYALVDPSNNKSKEWLKNTVVVIDPCINPDGRDRYVNWFNSVVGKNKNVNPEAREHREPWPGGRTNHYNFDLNRDWAWQTQVESRQRLAVYQQWMPQIHVDYHEQYPSNPYYFAPAAKPYHEVITPWQRDFQVMIGRNHAKYFDANGWLYFTKQVFDLFYPSYGDTYPIYNGAIGMTYEQAGHGISGTGIITGDGDTLTLHDRAIHHFTTGISTVETASKNADRLIREFKKYFDDAVGKGIGEYKTYVIKNSPEDGQRIHALLDLLEKNDILYEYAGLAPKGALTGYDYASGKDQSFSLEKGDILVQSQQSKSALIKVLFEPRSKLEDSATYDITAWSLPYVYGVKAMASKTRILSSGGTKPPAITNQAGEAYGYVIPWQGVQSARALSLLIQEGVKVRFTEQAFEENGKTYDRGSLIIVRKSNDAVWGKIASLVNNACNTAGITASTVSTGFVDQGYDFGSDKVHMIHPPKAALLTGEGTSGNDAGEIWYFFEQVLGYPVTLINVNDFGNVNKDHYDVLIMPAGYYGFLNDKAAAEELRQWIQQGGKLIALDRAVSQLARLDWTIKSKKPDDTDKKEEYEVLKTYEEREHDMIRSFIPGSIFKVELDNTHPLAFGYPDYYYTLKQDENMYEFIKERGWNVGVIKKDNQVAGFVGSKLKNKLQDGVVFGVQDIGRGNIVYFADNVLFRSFWENGKLLFCNALFLVGQ